MQIKPNANSPQDQPCNKDEKTEPPIPINTGGPAYPTIPENHGYKDAHGTGSDSGMTLRDKFAIATLTGIYANHKFDSTHHEPNTTHYTRIAKIAYAQADAMLKPPESN